MNNSQRLLTSVCFLTQVSRNLVRLITLTARHSPLLLSQLPLPRGTKEARWEVDAPLDIALFALSFDDCERKMMGTRLLTLVGL